MPSQHPNSYPKRVRLWRMTWRVEVRKRKNGYGACLTHVRDNQYWYLARPEDMKSIKDHLSSHKAGKVINDRQIWVDDIDHLVWLELMYGCV